MLSREIIKILDDQSPAEYAMDWDNVGLLIGRSDKKVNKILIAVDATLEVCEAAINEGVDMIITHHPIIFSPINKINDNTVLGKKILALIESSVVCYAMHTNFDTIGGMAKIAASKLGLKNTSVLQETLNGEGIGIKGVLDKSATIQELGKNVKEKFGLKNVMIYGEKAVSVDNIAISPGSGKSVISDAVASGVECLITGDIGHHEGIDAVEMGLSIIDASHYGLEKIFMEYIYTYLSEYCNDVEIIIADVGEPFSVL